MKKNMLPLLGIAFVVATVSTGLFYGLFASKLSGNAGDWPKQNVVLAARKLGRGSVVASADVKVAELRGRTALGGAFSRPEQVVGSTLAEGVEESEAFTGRSLGRQGTIDPGVVPEGMRALTLHVVESGGVLALVRSGSRVDIQAISEQRTSPSETHTVLRTVLQNVAVLSPAAQPEQVALHYSAPTVTVLVRAEDCDLAAVADAGSRIRLALRNGGDMATSERVPLTTPAVFATKPTGNASARRSAPVNTARSRGSAEPADVGGSSQDR